MEKKYDFQKAETALEKMWQDEEIYRYQNGKERKIFSIDTPPPTVSGKLHIGHVFSYTQAEMITRFKRMQGYDVFYPFGFDDNGLPTERLVERDEKIRANQMPRSEFRAKCMKTIGTYEDEFKALWSRLGFSVDWNLQYQTISDRAQKISQRSFLELAKKKKAYMKTSPVLIREPAQLCVHLTAILLMLSGMKSTIWHTRKSFFRTAQSARKLVLLVE